MLWVCIPRTKLQPFTKDTEGYIEMIEALEIMLKFSSLFDNVSGYRHQLQALLQRLQRRRARMKAGLPFWMPRLHQSVLCSLPQTRPPPWMTTGMHSRYTCSVRYLALGVHHWFYSSQVSPVLSGIVWQSAQSSTISCSHMTSMLNIVSEDLVFSCDQVC